MKLKSMFARFTSAGTISAVFLAVALISAPLPMLVPGTAAQSTKTATKSATKTKPKKAKRAPTPAQHALHSRIRKCGAEWKTAKAAGKIGKGIKWPQYWRACNKRLKAGD